MLFGILESSTRSGEDSTKRDQLQSAVRAAAEAKPRQVAPPPYPTAGQLAALWDDVEGTLAASPHEAKEVLNNRFEPVVLTPTEEGWTMETAMRLGPALEVPIRFDPVVRRNDRVEMWPKSGCGGAP